MKFKILGHFLPHIRTRVMVMIVSSACVFNALQAENSNSMSLWQGTKITLGTLGGGIVGGGIRQLFNNWNNNRPWLDVSPLKSLWDLKYLQVDELKNGLSNPVIATGLGVVAGVTGGYLFSQYLRGGAENSVVAPVEPEIKKGGFEQPKFLKELAAEEENIKNKRERGIYAPSAQQKEEIIKNKYVDKLLELNATQLRKAIIFALYSDTRHFAQRLQAAFETIINSSMLAEIVEQKKLKESFEGGLKAIKEHLSREAESKKSIKEEGSSSKRDSKVSKLGNNVRRVPEIGPAQNSRRVAAIIRQWDTVLIEAGLREIDKDASINLEAEAKEEQEEINKIIVKLFRLDDEGIGMVVDLALSPAAEANKAGQLQLAFEKIIKTKELVKLAEQKKIKNACQQGLKSIEKHFDFLKRKDSAASLVSIVKPPLSEVVDSKPLSEQNQEVSIQPSAYGVFFRKDFSNQDFGKDENALFAVVPGVALTANEIIKSALEKFKTETSDYDSADFLLMSSRDIDGNRSVMKYSGSKVVPGGLKKLTLIRRIPGIRQSEPNGNVVKKDKGKESLQEDDEKGKRQIQEVIASPRRYRVVQTGPSVLLDSMTPQELLQQLSGKNLDGYFESVLPDEQKIHDNNYIEYEEIDAKGLSFFSQPNPDEERRKKPKQEYNNQNYEPFVIFEFQQKLPTEKSEIHKDNLVANVTEEKSPGGDLTENQVAQQTSELYPNSDWYDNYNRAVQDDVNKKDEKQKLDNFMKALRDKKEADSKNPEYEARQAKIRETIKEAQIRNEGEGFDEPDPIPLNLKPSQSPAYRLLQAEHAAEKDIKRILKDTKLREGVEARHSKIQRLLFERERYEKDLEQFIKKEARESSSAAKSDELLLKKKQSDQQIVEGIAAFQRTRDKKVVARSTNNHQEKERIKMTNSYTDALKKRRDEGELLYSDEVGLLMKEWRGASGNANKIYKIREVYKSKEDGAFSEQYQFHDAPKDYTPLLIAISEDNAGLVEHLLKEGADANLGTSIGTPLPLAIVLGRQEIIKHLLNHEKTNLAIFGDPKLIEHAQESKQGMLKKGLRAAFSEIIDNDQLLARTGQTKETIKGWLQALKEDVVGVPVTPISESVPDERPKITVSSKFYGDNPTTTDFRAAIRCSDAAKGVEMAKELLAKDVSITNSACEDMTPLGYACNKEAWAVGIELLKKHWLLTLDKDKHEDIDGLASMVKEIRVGRILQFAKDHRTFQAIKFRKLLYHLLCKISPRATGVNELKSLVEQEAKKSSGMSSKKVVQKASSGRETGLMAYLWGSKSKSSSNVTDANSTAIKMSLSERDAKEDLEGAIIFGDLAKFQEFYSDYQPEVESLLSKNFCCLEVALRNGEWDIALWLLEEEKVRPSKNHLDLIINSKQLGAEEFRKKIDPVLEDKHPHFFIDHGLDLAEAIDDDARSDNMTGSFENGMIEGNASSVAPAETGSSSSTSVSASGKQEKKVVRKPKSGLANTDMTKTGTGGKKPRKLDPFPVGRSAGAIAQSNDKPGATSSPLAVDPMLQSMILSSFSLGKPDESKKD